MHEGQETKFEGLNKSCLEYSHLAHPKKGHGLGRKSSAEKFREKAELLKDLETTRSLAGKKALELDLVGYAFDAREWWLLWAMLLICSQRFSDEIPNNQSVPFPFPLTTLGPRLASST